MAQRTLINGVELRWWRSGAGPALICLHDTGTTAEVWRPLAQALDQRATTIAYDRRGWGASTAPEQYTRTTVEEQAADAAGLLEELVAAPAIICGAGLGAAAALDLAVRNRPLVSAAVLIEPPLLALVPEATEALGKDRLLLEQAVRGGGPAAGLEVYLSGSLRASAGAERIPDALVDRNRPLSFFAELGAMPAWTLPMRALRSCAVPCLVVLARSTPPLVRAAADVLCALLPDSRLLDLQTTGAPHLDSADEIAAALLSLG